jgi:hypothetical protein
VLIVTHCCSLTRGARVEEFEQFDAVQTLLTTPLSSFLTE